MARPPTTSVIIPVFNRERLIREAIRSIQAQSLVDWEIIIVDDGSSDRSWDVVTEISAGDTRIKPFRRRSPDKGASICRNEGLSIAAGKYVVFLDSDDCLGPIALETRADFMDNHQELDFAVFQTELFERNPGDLQLLWNIQKKRDTLTRFLEFDVPWPICGPVWRRNAIQRIGGFLESLSSSQDWELHVRALANGLRYQWLDPVNAYVRVAGQGHQSITTEAVSRFDPKSRLQMWQHVVSTLSAHERITAERRKVLAATWFQLANQARAQTGMDDARSMLVWAKSNGILDNDQYDSRMRALSIRDHVSKLAFGNWLEQLIVKLLYRNSKRPESTFNHSCVALDVVRRARRDRSTDVDQGVFR